MKLTESEKEKRRTVNKKILKIFAWIVGIPVVFILIIQILGSPPSSPPPPSPEKPNKLLTDGTLEVFQHENSIYLVTGLSILSPENLKAILPQICEATGTDKWQEYETINIVNVHQKIAKRLPSMSEACAAPGSYFPTESVESALIQAEYIERIGYGAYRY